MAAAEEADQQAQTSASPSEDTVVATAEVRADTVADLTAALRLAEQRISELESAGNARAGQLEQRLAELEKAFAVAEETKSALLAATLQAARALAPIESGLNDLKGEVARLSAMANSESDAGVQDDSSAQSGIVEGLAVLEDRVAKLESLVASLGTASPTTTQSTQDTATLPQTTETDEPFELVKDETGHPAIRKVAQLEKLRQDLVKASTCKTVGAWVTPRTAQGDNASFFVMDGREVKVCRRIGEVWFALAEKPDYPAFVVLQN